MAKPVIKFKTYRQAAAVGGKIYGVPNLGDPVVAEVTMQEVIDYAKLHNYSADTLSALLSQVIAGVGDLVARDGRPRMLSDLLKFEPVIKGTFDNMHQTVTNQKVLVRPRMLKEIKVSLDPTQYSWQNQNDKDGPRLISVAPDSETYPEVNLQAFIASLNGFAETGGFGWTYAGNRLCPNGFDSTCDLDVVLDYKTPYQVDGYTVKLLHLGFKQINDEETAGIFRYASGDPATDNTLKVARSNPATNAAAWIIVDGGFLPLSSDSVHTPSAGDVVRFIFSRTLGTGEAYTVEKSYTL